VSRLGAALVIERGYSAVGTLYVKDNSIVGFATTYATESEMRACADRINALAASRRASTPRMNR
jgi:hypothetical protein